MTTDSTASPKPSPSPSKGEALKAADPARGGVGAARIEQYLQVLVRRRVLTDAAGRSTTARRFSPCWRSTGEPLRPATPVRADTYTGTAASAARRSQPDAG